MFFINEFIGDPFPSVSTDNKVNNKSKKTNYVYLLNDDKILKLLVTIDESIIKENFIKLKQNINMSDYTTTSQYNLNKNNFTVEDNHFYFPFKGYCIPDKSKENCSLLYALNIIYNKKTLSSDDIFKLNEEKEYYSKYNNCDKLTLASIEVIKNIVDSLEIEIIDEYDYKLFSDSINFLETIRSKEKLNIFSELNQLKNILLTAEGNKDVFEFLNIHVNLEEEKDFRK